MTRAEEPMEMSELSPERMLSLLMADIRGGRAEGERTQARIRQLISERMVAGGLSAPPEPSEEGTAAGREIGEQIIADILPVLARRLTADQESVPLFSTEEMTDVLRTTIRRICDALEKKEGTAPEELEEIGGFFSGYIESYLQDLRRSFAEDGYAYRRRWVRVLFDVAAAQGSEPEAVLADPILRNEITRRTRTPEEYRGIFVKVQEYVADPEAMKRHILSGMDRAFGDEDDLTAAEAEEEAAEIDAFVTRYCRAMKEATETITAETMARIWPERF